jgi:hypothetical protein
MVYANAVLLFFTAMSDLNAQIGVWLHSTGYLIMPEALYEGPDFLYWEEHYILGPLWAESSRDPSTGADDFERQIPHRMAFRRARKYGRPMKQTPVSLKKFSKLLAELSYHILELAYTKKELKKSLMIRERDYLFERCRHFPPPI